MSCCSLPSAESDSVTDCVSASSRSSSPALKRRTTTPRKLLTCWDWLRSDCCCLQVDKAVNWVFNKSPVSSCILCSTVTWVYMCRLVPPSEFSSNRSSRAIQQRKKSKNTYQEIIDKSRLSKSLKISLYRFVSDLGCIFFTSEINSTKIKPLIHWHWHSMRCCSAHNPQS